MNLIHLLHRLSSPDNEPRQAAERELASMRSSDAAGLLLGLSGLIADPSVDGQLRTFACILLRRCGLQSTDQSTDQSAHWLQLNHSQQSAIRSQLLNTWHAEQLDPNVRRKLTDTLAELAILIRTDDQVHQRMQFSWPELMAVLHQIMSTNTSGHCMQDALRLVATVPSLLWPVHEESGQDAFVHDMQAWKSVLVQCLQSSHSHDLQLSALKTVVALLLCEEWTDAKLRTHWSSDLMVHMANVLLPLMNASSRNEEALSEALEAFIELAEALPRLLKDLMKTLVPFLVGIVCANGEQDGLEDQARQTALEVLVTLAETAPGMCRKLENPSFCAQVVPAAMLMMTEIEDDEDWYTTDNLDSSEDADCNYVVGEQAMDRLARALGGKHLLPATFQLLPSFFGSAEWTQRYAALMCISAIGEGCIKIMEKELDKVVDMVLPHLVRDPHPRVRYAACNAIGQMCTDFAPELQEQFHEKIVGGLCATMECVDQPRVQAHGAAALVNFCEQASQGAITPYLETIFARLTVLLQTPRTYLQEQAITTLATVADAAGDQFVAYYSGVIVVLLNILETATAKEYRLLRGKAMECASLIALAVGKEHFAPHAKQLIDYMMQTQQTATDPDDPQASYLLAAWARICKVLGADFVPYLDVVMPPLIASAQHRPDVAVLDPEDNEEEKGFSADDGWEFVKIDQQKIGIKTSALEEKCTAVEMLICYARELGAGFQQYAEPVLRLVVPLLNFYFHEGVRHAAAAVLPHLFNSMKSANYPPQQLATLWHQSISSLLVVINDEPDAETLVQFLIAFYESLQIMGPNSLANATVYPLPSPSQPGEDGGDGSNTPKVHPIAEENIPLLAYFCRAITGQISEVSHRIQTRAAQRQDVDLYDPEMEETLRNEEDMEDAVLGELSRAVHIVFKMHGQSFLPYFHQGLLPVVSGMLHAQLPGTPTENGAAASLQSVTAANQARQWAICVMDDLIEFCGASSAWEYRSHFWDAFLQGVMNVRYNTDGGSTDVRQACCYGLGVLAQSVVKYNAADSADEQSRRRLLDQWAPLLLEALSMLITSLSTQYKQQHQRRTRAAHQLGDEEEDDGQQLADENAVSAIGKLMHYTLTPLLLGQSSLINNAQFDQVLQQWHQHLPIVEDDEESIHTYGYLLHLLFGGGLSATIASQPVPIDGQKLNPLLTGSPALMERTWLILIQALTGDVLPLPTANAQPTPSTPSTGMGAVAIAEFGQPLQIAQRVAEAAKLIGERCSAEQRQRVWSQLTDEQRQKLGQLGWI